MENQETFWMVWREGDRGPVVKHGDMGNAFNEAGRLADENPGTPFYVLKKIGLARIDPNPIRRVFEQYRHLDKLISEKRWGVCAGPGLTPHLQCLRDLWQAIKESQEGKEKAL